MTVVDVMRQMIEEALYGASISSAGGDSPKKNFVFAGTVNINPVDFENVLTSEMDSFMQERLPKVIEENGEDIKKTIMDDPEIKKMVGLFRGGTSGFATNLLRVAGPIFVALLAPKMAEAVFKWITRPGGILDLRFKRVLENEQNAFLDRQTQYNTQVGLRQVIIQSTAGFRNINGMANENTLRQIREGGANGNRFAMIDITDHSRGLFD